MRLNFRMNNSHKSYKFLSCINKDLIIKYLLLNILTKTKV